MELNKEDIIKALEHCKSAKLTKCYGCPREQEDGHCMYRLNEDALSLIKELTEDIEWSANRIIEADKKVAELTEENERLRAEKEAENKELFYKWKKIADETADRYEALYQDAKKALKADTVREMQERLDKHFCHDPAFLGVEQRLIMDIIAQIAEEIISGGS